jgi:hypothetical protein
LLETYTQAVKATTTTTTTLHNKPTQPTTNLYKHKSSNPSKENLTQNQILLTQVAITKKPPQIS